MVYLINCFVMRNFAYKNPDYIKNEVVPELVEEHPCYQQSVYDTVMYDESLDGITIGVKHIKLIQKCTELLFYNDQSSKVYYRYVEAARLYDSVLKDM